MSNAQFGAGGSASRRELKILMLSSNTGRLRPPFLLTPAETFGLNRRGGRPLRVPTVTSSNFAPVPSGRGGALIWRLRTD